MSTLTCFRPTDPTTPSRSSVEHATEAAVGRAHDHRSHESIAVAARHYCVGGSPGGLVRAAALHWTGGALAVDLRRRCSAGAGLRALARDRVTREARRRHGNHRSGLLCAHRAFSVVDLWRGLVTVAVDRHRVDYLRGRVYRPGAGMTERPDSRDSRACKGRQGPRPWATARCSRTARGPRACARDWRW